MWWDGSVASKHIMKSSQEEQGVQPSKIDILPTENGLKTSQHWILINPTEFSRELAVGWSSGFLAVSCWFVGGIFHVVGPYRASVSWVPPTEVRLKRSWSSYGSHWLTDPMVLDSQHDKAEGPQVLVTTRWRCCVMQGMSTTRNKFRYLNLGSIQTSMFYVSFQMYTYAYPLVIKDGNQRLRISVVDRPTWIIDVECSIARLDSPKARSQLSRIFHHHRWWLVSIPIDCFFGQYGS